LTAVVEHNLTEVLATYNGISDC